MIWDSRPSTYMKAALWPRETGNFWIHSAVLKSSSLTLRFPVSSLIFETDLFCHLLLSLVAAGRFILLY